MNAASEGCTSRRVCSTLKSPMPNPARYQGKNLGFEGGNRGVAAYRKTPIKAMPPAAISKFVGLTRCHRQLAERRCLMENDVSTKRSKPVNTSSWRDENAPPVMNRAIMQP